MNELLKRQLAHECVHVANHILLEKGVMEEKGEDETAAYFVGYLVRHLLEAFRQTEANAPADVQATEVLPSLLQ